MNLYILGIIAGICIGYLLFSVRAIYDPKLHTLSFKSILGNFDKESIDNIFKFIDECIKRKTKGE